MAEACIAAGKNGEIDLHGSVLETQSALSREDLQKGANNKKMETKKDNRNLYLVKEGSKYSFLLFLKICSIFPC